jgi:hypothetical protein
MRWLRSPVSVTFSVAAVRRRTGASAARATSSPSAVAIAMPAAAIRISQFLIRASVWSTSFSGRTT